MEFEEYVDEAIKGLPKEFREKLDNVSVFVEDWPRNNAPLLGLYEGIPKTRRGSYGVGGAVPDKITLFKYPILSIAHSPEHLIKLIRDTLYHEIGHHFGMSEEDIRKASKRV